VLNRLIIGLLVLKATTRAARFLAQHAYAAGLRDIYGRNTCERTP